MDLMHHFENLTYGTLWAIWSILVMSSYRSPGSIYSTGFSCHWEASMIRSCRSFFAWRGGPYYTDFRPPLAIADFQLQTNNLTTWSGFKESLEAAGEALRQLDGVGQVVILLHSPGATADGQPKGPQNQRFTAAPAACRDDSKPNSWRKCRVESYMALASLRDAGVFFFLWLGSSPNVAVLGAKSRLKSRLCLKHEDFGWCFLFICGADVFGGLELCLRDSQNPKHQASLGRSRCKVWRPKNIYPKPCIPSVLPPLFFWYFPHSLPLQSHSFSMFFQLLRFGVFTSGVVSAIGVSNFLKRHLEELRRDLKGHALAGAVGGAPPGLKTWPPDVVQHEVHLLRREEELLRYCRLWNITAT